MEILEILLVLFFAIIISAIFYFGFGGRGPFGAFWVYLVLLFLAGLAGRFWIIPSGPETWGYSWFPVIFWMILIALLMSAGSSTQPKRVTPAGDQEREESQLDETRAEIDRRVANKKVTPGGATAAFGVFSWIFLFLLLLAILTGSLL